MRRHSLLITALIAAVTAGALAFLIADPGGRDRVPAGIGSPRVSAVGSPGTPADAQDSETNKLIAKLETTIRGGSGDTNSYTALGLAYLQRVRETGDPTDYGRAQAALDEALRRSPNSVEALVGKGTLALARHKFREALELGEKARALAPEVSRIYGVIGDAQVELGRYDEALQSIQAMVDKRPDLSSYSRVSYVRELHGQVKNAIKAMEEAVSSGGPFAENTEYVRIQLGNLYFNSGDLAQAERTYQTSLKDLPDYVFALGGLGRVRAAQGRYDEAIELFRRAVDRIPLPEFAIALGETQEAAGKREDAARTYELVRTIQKLFQANGVDVDLELALFDADHGTDPAATLELARKAHADRPSIRAADALGWALYKAGQPQEAKKYALEALRLGTKDASLMYHAGVIAAAAGDPDAARRWLTSALETNPHFSPLYAPKAQEALTALERTSSP